MKALVTGASSGMGRDMAKYLYSLGYELYLVARNKKDLNREFKGYKNIHTYGYNLIIEEECVKLYKELKDDLNIPISDKGDLTCWAKEGVLLLNSVLTVEKDKPASHKNLGWENFTDAIIKKINEKDTPVVFILWGNFAKSKKSLITNPKHLVLESSHPSPFSCNYGFFGSRPFSKTNKFLKEHNLKEIDFTVR